jgi:hypothetical protein
VHVLERRHVNVRLKGPSALRVTMTLLLIAWIGGSMLVAILICVAALVHDLRTRQLHRRSAGCDKTPAETAEAH